MLLSLLGMDGYFQYRGPNYYLIGEWFFGAIVFLYILYPLFAKYMGCEEVRFSASSGIAWTSTTKPLQYDTRYVSILMYTRRTQPKHPAAGTIIL